MSVYTHTLSLSISGFGKATLNGASVAGNAQKGGQWSVPPSTTNQQILVDFTLASLQSLWITSDQPLTLKTNSTGSPTITLAANVPYHWQVNSGESDPLSADVTTVYATNASGTNTANLTILALTN